MQTKSVLAAVCLIGGLVPAVLSGQRPVAGLEVPDAAWDKGEYVAALKGYLALMHGPEGDRFLEPIALRTGELHESIEVTKDGQAPRFSPDGRLIAYETADGQTRTTHLVDVSGVPAPVASLPGHAGVFSPSGDRFAFLRIRPASDLEQALAELKSAAGPARQAQQQMINWLQMKHSEVVVRDLATRRERVLNCGGLLKSALAYGADGSLYLLGAPEGNESRSDVYALSEAGAEPEAVTKADGFKTSPLVDPSGRFLLYFIPARNPFQRPGQAGGGQAPPLRGPSPASFGVEKIGGGGATVIDGTAPAFSADGSTLAYVGRAADEYHLMVGPPGEPATAVKKTRQRLDAPALSPDGSRVVFQAMPKDDWELFVIDRDGGNETRLTREIQHDLQPRFLDDSTVLGLVGESRHRRSYLYDLRTLERTRLFHNNTVRTIAPEYAWTASRDGTKVLIVAERDGDTVSPERGVYLMRLDRKVTRDDLVARLE
jgi:hypothetical protein